MRRCTCLFNPPEAKVICCFKSATSLHRCSTSQTQKVPWKGPKNSARCPIIRKYSPPVAKLCTNLEIRHCTENVRSRPVMLPENSAAHILRLQTHTKKRKKMCWRTDQEISDVRVRPTFEECHHTCSMSLRMTHTTDQSIRRIRTVKNHSLTTCIH